MARTTEQQKTIALTVATKVELDLIKATLQLSHDELVQVLIKSYKKRKKIAE